MLPSLASLVGLPLSYFENIIIDGDRKDCASSRNQPEASLALADGGHAAPVLAYNTGLIINLVLYLRMQAVVRCYECCRIKQHAPTLCATHGLIVYVWALGLYSAGGPLCFRYVTI